MARIGLRSLLCVLALACAPTSKTIQGRAFSYTVKNEVTEVSPGHWTGPWSNVGISVDSPGRKDEMTLTCVESGIFDGVWTSPTQVTSCTNKSTKICTHRDGSTTTGENTMTCKPGPDGKLIFEGTGKQIAGTGRFAGGDSGWSFTSWQLTTPPNDSVYAQYKTTYTLPKK